MAGRGRCPARGSGPGRLSTPHLGLIETQTEWLRHRGLSALGPWPCGCAMGVAAYNARSTRSTHGHTAILYPRTVGARRCGGHRGSLCAAEKRWRQLHGALPFSWRKVALVLGQPDQAIFPLLWLWQEWQCHWFFDGPRRHELCRSRQGPGPNLWHAGARRRCLAPRPRTRGPCARAPSHFERCAGKSGQRLLQASEKFTVGWSIPQGPWPDGGNR